MKREVIDCDCCGKVNAIGAQSIAIRTGRSYNGVDYDTDTETVDLCPTCLSTQLRVVVEKAGEEFCKEWARTVRKKTCQT